MTDTRNTRRIKPPRIQLNDRILQHLKDKTTGMAISDLAKRSGLPYGLVYNVFHKRVGSISARNYRLLFSEPVPQQNPKRVDGTRFRQLVRLWLYLNDEASKSDLYAELYGYRHNKKVDYRIFSEKIKTVEASLELTMEKKFLDSGIDLETLEQWLNESDKFEPEDRIPYDTIRPLLQFIHTHIGVHPTSVLHQFSDRYERGDLKTVSVKIFQKAEQFKRRAEKALARGNDFEIERIREEIYGVKKGYTLYVGIVQELRFLQQYAKKSPKRYLGRGTYMYEKGGCKRVPTWRARLIMEDCDRFIKNRMDLPLAVLPRSFQQRWVEKIRTTLVLRAADMLSKVDGIVLEKKILSPVRAIELYKKYDHGFTQFDRASTTLGMRKAAFDLMVAKNCEIFREVGRYSRRWYLSDLYLKELTENPYFKLVTAKYERLANTIGGKDPSDQCLAPNVA